MSIFDTPILTPFLRLIFWPIVWLIGWRCPRPLPRDLKKCVIVVAPHTSYWDFALFILLVIAYRMRVNVLVKHSVFIGPLAWLLHYCGAIPIDRRRPNARIAEIVKLFAARDCLNLVITPEGTRGPRTHWKMGFFHIAQAADVPVVVAYLDAHKKEVSMGYQFQPKQADMETQMQKLYAFYDQCAGINPQNYASPNRPSSDN